MNYEIESLWNAFNDAPDELFRLGIIADAYDEIGDEDAANCLRWALREGKKPDKTIYETYEWWRAERETGNSLVPRQWDLPGENEIFLERTEYEKQMHMRYYRGDQTTALAYQLIIELWKHNGGVKETVSV